MLTIKCKPEKYKDDYTLKILNSIYYATDIFIVLPGNIPNSYNIFTNDTHYGCDCINLVAVDVPQEDILKLVDCAPVIMWVKKFEKIFTIPPLKSFGEDIGRILCSVEFEDVYPNNTDAYLGYCTAAFRVICEKSDISFEDLAKKANKLFWSTRREANLPMVGILDDGKYNLRKEAYFNKNAVRAYFLEAINLMQRKEPKVETIKTKFVDRAMNGTTFCLVESLENNDLYIAEHIPEDNSVCMYKINKNDFDYLKDNLPFYGLMEKCNIPMELDIYACVKDVGRAHIGRLSRYVESSFIKDCMLAVETFRDVGIFRADIEEELGRYFVDLDSLVYDKFEKDINTKIVSTVYKKVKLRIGTFS